MNGDQLFREQVSKLLDGRIAHLTFDEAVDGFPMGHINSCPPHVPYTPWHILEHLRISQWDILEFMRDPDHISPEWPSGYWPDPSSTATPEQWTQTKALFRADLASIKAMVADPSIELAAELPHAPGYTYIREYLLVVDHNAYHLGEFAILRQVMNTWPKDRRG